MIFSCATSGTHQEDTRAKEIQLITKRNVCVSAHVRARTHTGLKETLLSVDKDFEYQQLVWFFMWQKQR